MTAILVQEEHPLQLIFENYATQVIILMLQKLPESPFVVMALRQVQKNETIATQIVMMDDSQTAQELKHHGCASVDLLQLLMYAHSDHLVSIKTVLLILNIVLHVVVMD